MINYKIYKEEKRVTAWNCPVVLYVCKLHTRGCQNDKYVLRSSITKHCLGVHRDVDGTDTAGHDISCSATVFMGFLRSLYKVARSKK